MEKHNELKIDEKMVKESSRDFKVAQVVSFMLIISSAWLGYYIIFDNDKLLFSTLSFVCLLVATAGMYISYKGLKILQSVKEVETVFDSSEDGLIIFDQEILSREIESVGIVTNTGTAIPFINYDNQERQVVDLFIKFRNDIPYFPFSNKENINGDMWFRLNLSALTGYRNALKSINSIQKILDSKEINNHYENNLKDFYQLVYKKFI